MSHLDQQQIIAFSGCALPDCPLTTHSLQAHWGAPLAGQIALLLSRQRRRGWPCIDKTMPHFYSSFCLQGMGFPLKA